MLKDDSDENDEENNRLTIFSIPDEIINYIGKFVDRKDVKNLKLTCKLFNENIGYEAFVNSDFYHISKKDYVDIYSLSELKFDHYSVTIESDYQFFNNYNPTDLRKEIGSVIIMPLNNKVILPFSKALINSGAFNTIYIKSDRMTFIVFFYLNRLYINVFDHYHRLYSVCYLKLVDDLLGVSFQKEGFYDYFTKKIIANGYIYNHNYLTMDFEKILYMKNNVLDVVEYNGFMLRDLLYIGNGKIYVMVGFTGHGLAIEDKEKYNQEELNILMKFEKSDFRYNDQEFDMLNKIFDRVMEC
jgi:hypothetical protein